MNKNKTIPFLAGFSILLITPITIYACVYSAFRTDVAKQSTETGGNSSTTNSSAGGLTTESRGTLSTKSSKKIAPSFSVEQSGAGGNVDPDSTTGIPTGKYSHPPTQIIKSGNAVLSSPDQQSPTDDFSSSVVRNRSIQEKMDTSNSSFEDSSKNSSLYSPLPAYSKPSSSNDFDSPQGDSLIKPLKNDSLVESPSSTSQTTPLSPTTETLSPSSSSSLSPSSSLEP